MPLRNAFADLATEPTLAAVLAAVDGLEAALAALQTELNQKYEGGPLALDAATLAALESVTATVANFPAAQKVTDDYQAGEVLADQNGGGAVLTFTFAAAVHLVVVDANGTATDVARADPFGGTPAASTGIPCRDEVPTFMPVTTSSVKVWAPSGMVVSVYGYRRA